MPWLCRNCEAWYANDNGRICEVCQEVRPPELPASARPRAAVAAAPRSRTVHRGGASTSSSRRTRASILTVVVVIFLIVIMNALLQKPDASPVASVRGVPSAAAEEPPPSADLAAVSCTQTESVSCAVEIRNGGEDAVMIRLQAANSHGRTALVLPDGTASGSAAIGGDAESLDIEVPPHGTASAPVIFGSMPGTLSGATFTLAWTEYASSGARERSRSLVIEK